MTGRLRGDLCLILGSAMGSALQQGNIVKVGKVKDNGRSQGGGDIQR